MFIEKISIFLPEYSNMRKDSFIDLLKSVNKQKFNELKLEKDFLLTVILIKFGEKYPDLIFKGGTCLNKVYFPYFRLSEDLDFVINFDGGKKARRTLLKKYELAFIDDLGKLGLKIKEGENKFDTYRLGMFTFEYKSVINGLIGTIKIDISLKSKLQLPSIKGEIKSIYIDKVFEEDLFKTHFINCIDIKESVSEKLRAGLTRKVPAIRDFFDIWYIKVNSDFDFDEKEFVDLLNLKLTEVEYNYSLEDNFELLKKQVKTDLKPVLNEDFDFDFDDVYDFVLGFKK